MYAEVLTPVNTPDITITPSLPSPIADCANPTTGNVVISDAYDFVTSGFPLVLLNPEIKTGSPFAIETPLSFVTSNV